MPPLDRPPSTCILEKQDGGGDHSFLFTVALVRLAPGAWSEAASNSSKYLFMKQTVDTWLWNSPSWIVMWGYHGNVHRWWRRVRGKRCAGYFIGSQTQEVLPRFGPSVGGRNLVLLVGLWMMMKMLITRCLDSYGRADAILPRVDRIRLQEHLPDSLSLPLYRRLGLLYLIRGFISSGSVLAASFRWDPYWAAPHMLTGSTRWVIPTKYLPSI
jgi:hypothetical protein